MRVWDFDPKFLCRNHLLGEHSEIHAIWSIIVNQKRGYQNHPEVKRWQGKLRALFSRHERLKKELKKRGYRHQSPLNFKLAKGKRIQNQMVDSLEKQRKILRKKGCSCRARWIDKRFSSC